MWGAIRDQVSTGSRRFFPRGGGTEQIEVSVSGRQVGEKGLSHRCVVIDLLILATQIAAASGACARAEGDENWWDGFGAPPLGQGVAGGLARSVSCVHGDRLILGGTCTQAGALATTGLAA